MMQLFILVIGFALFSVALAALATSRHIIVMIAAVEIALVASGLVALSNMGSIDSTGIVDLLLVIWAIAAAEVMVLIVLYRYMLKEGISLNLSKLSGHGEK